MQTLLLLWMVPLLALPARVQTTGDDLKALAARVTDYPTKFRLVRAGAAALPVLMEQLADGDAARQFETRSALRWIVAYAGERPGGVPEVAQALGAWLGKERPAAARSFAAELLGELGVASAAEPLASLLDEPEVRVAALAALERIPDQAGNRVLVRALAGADATLKPLVLRALARRHEPSTLEVLRVLTYAGDMRAVALECLGILGDVRGVPALAEAAGKEPDHAVAFQALLHIGQARGQGADAVSAFARAFDVAAEDGERTAALDGLAAATLGEGLDTVERGLAAGDAAVKDRAWRALAAIADGRCGKDRAASSALVRRVLAGSTDVLALLRALAVAARVADVELVPAVERFLAHDRRPVQAAAVTVLREHGTPAARAVLRSALEGPAQALALEALAVCRDRDAVPAIVALAQKGDAAAVRALGRIGDPRAAEALLPAAAGGDANALDGCLQIAGQSDPAAARAIYHRLLEARAEPRVLAALERVVSGDSVPVLDKVLATADGERRTAALRCLTAAGDRLQAGGARDAALKAFTRAQELGATGIEDRLRSLGQKIEVVARDGRIDAWWLIGPFAAPDRASWSRAEFPEQKVDLAVGGKAGDRELRWKPFTTTEPDAVVHLDPLFTPNDNVFAYASCELLVKKAHAVKLRCGSDDGIVVWLNGQKVHEFLGPRGLKVDEDTVAVSLQEGVNTLLLKVIDIGGGWDFNVRLLDEDGQPTRFRIR